MLARGEVEQRVLVASRLGEHLLQWGHGPMLA
jgi:hypothetical protein